AAPLDVVEARDPCLRIVAHRTPLLGFITVDADGPRKPSRRRRWPDRNGADESPDEPLPILVAVRESHAGRLLAHVGVRVSALAASRRFYASVLAPLGLVMTDEGEGWFSVDELFFGDGGSATSGLHVAFQAQDREAVDRFHAAAIEAGGRDNGAPGERADHPGYYGAYVLDPDGTDGEAGYNGAGERSRPCFGFSWVA